MKKHNRPWTILLISLVLVLLPVLVLHATQKEEGPPQPAGYFTPAELAKQADLIKKEDLRYDGKSFEEWRTHVLTELKPELRKGGFHALATFGANGYAREATIAIVEMIKGYDQNSASLFESEKEMLNEARLSLQKIGKPADAVLLEVIKNHPSKHARYFALDCLYWNNAVIPIPTLVVAVMDSDPAVCHKAINLLARNVDQENKSHLLNVLKEGNQAKPFLEAVAAALQAGNSETRRDAVSLLDSLGPVAKPAIPALLKSLQSGYYEEEKATLQALKSVGAEPKQLVQPLIEFLKAELVGKTGIPALPVVDFVPPGPAPTMVVKDALQPCLLIDELGQIGPEAAAGVPDLIEALKKPNLEVKLSAIKALGNIGPAAKAALSALQKVQVADDPVLNQPAAIAIQKITTNAKPSQAKP